MVRLHHEAIPALSPLYLVYQARLDHRRPMAVVPAALLRVHQVDRATSLVAIADVADLVEASVAAGLHHHGHPEVGAAVKAITSLAAVQWTVVVVDSDPTTARPRRIR